MKKNVLTLTAILLMSFASFQVFAQGFYIQGGLGYYSPASNEVLGPIITNLGEENETNGNIWGTFGKGVAVGGELGYMFSQNFGFGIGVDYVLGSEVVIEEFSNAGTGVADISNAKNKRLTLSPMFIVDAGSEKLSPFAKFGVVIPVLGQTDGFRSSNDPNTVSNLLLALFPDAVGFEAESIAKGQFAIGFNGDIGLNFNITENIAVFGSVGYTALRIKRKTYEVSRADIVNADGTKEGALNLLSLGGVFPYTEYVDEIVADEFDAYQDEAAAAAAADPDWFTYYGTKDFPAKELTEDAAFNTLNFRVGARYTFKPGSKE